MNTTDQLLDQATERHCAGDLPEARRLYRAALAADPDHAVALVRSGLLELQEGHADLALANVRQAIGVMPAEPRYYFVLGEVLASVQRWNEAADSYQKSLEIEPFSAEVHFALGRARQATGDFRGAIPAYEAAATGHANSADAFNNLGSCHQALDEFAAAETAYRRAIELRPDDAAAMSNLGSVLQAMGRVDEALKVLRDAVTVAPGYAAAAINLGVALCRQRQFAEAELVLRPMLDCGDHAAEAAFALGNALTGLGRLPDAIEQYRRALDFRPTYIQALINLGNAYKETGDFTSASAAFEAALTAKPDSVDALNNFGCLLRSLGRLEEAETLFRRGLDINGRHAVLHANLGNVLKDAGELDHAIACFRTALKINPADSETHSNLLYSLSFSALDGKSILAESVRWNDRHAAHLESEQQSHHSKPSADRRLRIGYVSPDFREHCQSLFTLPLLSNHDHSGFEIFCYSSVARPDETTARIAPLANHWREVQTLDDAELSNLIRSDGIDVLVDLTMHMAGGRPLLFARKPAPIQVAWLAYPGTTGLAAMDYRLSDPRLDPPEFLDHYSEKTLLLPDAFWCYDPLTVEPMVNDLPALARGYVTFGCLNNPCKLTDHTLDLWSRVLRKLPDSRLMLMSPPGVYRQKLLARLAKRLVTADRIEFVPFRPRDQYLRSYHDVDLGLDTFPYNGHTTSLDSSWMGVPVITRVGPTCVGRGGLSQLFQLDLLELAAESDEDFADAAVRLACDLPRLSQLRQQLRPRLERSPLMDGRSFARNVEAAYRRMVDTTPAPGWRLEAPPSK